MTPQAWQLQTPVSAIVFDCDGTLSTLEGIDYLAANNGVGETVQALTAEAMGKSGLNPALYQQRLNLVNPNQQQVIELGQAYYQHRVPDSHDVIKLLQRLHKSVYVISAGLLPAVNIFAELLQIPHEHIFAVQIKFDEQGQFLDFDHTSPLIHNNGKRTLVTQLKIQHPHIIYVGDGLNDLSTIGIVTRFIGFGGVFYREKIAAQSDYYIDTLSMAPLLPLVLTQEEYETLSASEQRLVQKGKSILIK